MPTAASSSAAPAKSDRAVPRSRGGARACRSRDRASWRRPTEADPDPAPRELPDGPASASGLPDGARENDEATAPETGPAAGRSGAGSSSAPFPVRTSPTTPTIVIQAAESDGIPERDALTHGVAARPVPLGQRLAHDRDLRAVGAVRPAIDRPRHERDLHRPEVSRAGDEHDCILHDTRRRRLGAGDLERPERRRAVAERGDPT